MRSVFSKYGIDEELSKDQKLAALEKEKLKVLRKLNHVFGNPEKEVILNAELEALESAMDKLEETGGKLSLEDILIESRGLTQTNVEAGASEEALIHEKERLIKLQEAELEDIVSALYDVMLYYLEEREFVKYEYWLLYGARMGIPYFMKLLSDYYSKDIYEAEDEEKSFYWLKKGAEFGEKDCCETLGLYYANEQSEMYNPSQAAMCFVKAADSDHPNSYIFAFQMFHRLGEYKKAEMCLNAADQMEIQSAAHWFGMIYSNGENSSREKNSKLAQYWLEKEYQRFPNGNICYDLGSAYLLNGEKKKGIDVMLRGYNEFNNELCREVLIEIGYVEE